MLKNLFFALHEYLLISHHKNPKKGETETVTLSVN